MTATLDAPPFTLRWYQEECLDALFHWFATRDGDALAVLPTGSGKSAVLSAFIARARANYPPLRAVVLATRAELVKQNVKAASLFLPRQDIGIYSAGLGVKETSKPVTVANIQSLTRKVWDFDAVDLIVVDEAQDISDQDAGQYRTYFKAVRQQNPAAKIVGLTATPYKLSSGRLDEGQNALFAGVAYEAPVLRLIEEGFLCRPVTPRARLQLDTAGVQVRGDFVLKELAARVDVDSVTQAACDEMVVRFADRSHWLIFGVDVAHCQHIAAALTDRGISAGVVHGDLSRDERAYRLQAFHDGEIRALVSCQILTVGYDEPQVSALALMRPTKSAGLYAQQLGRGMRIHPSKSDCLVLDFADNISRFGPIDAIRVPDKKKKSEDGEAVVKVCPQCETYQPAGIRICVQCGTEFPAPPVVLNAHASTAPILSTDTEPEWHSVTECKYSRHAGKRLPDGTYKRDTLRVDYYAGFQRIHSEFQCVEHDGWARAKCERWFSERCAEPCPPDIDDAIQLLEADSRTPVAIGLRPQPANPKYMETAGYKWPDTPRAATGLPRACWSCEHWSPLQTQCQKWSATPPPDVQATCCEDWTDEALLPF